MNGASLTATLVVVFRETLEAGLIVGIILTVLHRLRAMRYARRVWSGTALAVGASLLAGWGLSLATRAGRGAGWEEGISGVISLAACAVLASRPQAFCITARGSSLMPWPWQARQESW